MEKRICKIGDFLRWFSSENDLSKLPERVYDLFSVWAIKDGELIFGEPNEELADNGKAYLELLIANDESEIILKIEDSDNGNFTHCVSFKFEQFEFEVQLLGFPFAEEFMSLID